MCNIPCLKQSSLLLDLWLHPNLSAKTFNIYQALPRWIQTAPCVKRVHLTRRWWELIGGAISGSLTLLQSDDCFFKSLSFSIFHYCFIYSSAGLPPRSYTRPSVQTYGPVNRIVSGKKNKRQSVIPQISKYRVSAEFLWWHICAVLYEYARCYPEPRVTTTEKWLHVVFTHRNTHTHIQTVLCQRGGILFIYCLYT